MLRLPIKRVQGARHPDGHAILPAQAPRGIRRAVLLLVQLRAVRRYVAADHLDSARGGRGRGAVFHRRGVHLPAHDRRRGLPRIRSPPPRQDSPLGRHPVRRRLRAHEDPREDRQPHRKEASWRRVPHAGRSDGNPRRPACAGGLGRGTASAAQAPRRAHPHRPAPAGRPRRHDPIHRRRDAPTDGDGASRPSGTRRTPRSAPSAA